MFSLSLSIASAALSAFADEAYAYLGRAWEAATGSAFWLDAALTQMKTAIEAAEAAGLDDVAEALRQNAEAIDGSLYTLYTRAEGLYDARRALAAPIEA